jgi:hypothetical protein
MTLAAEPIPATEPSTVDETRYGPGPWVGEPDRLEWRHRGVPCLMVRNMEIGNWCGYAAVPPGHPWHGKDTDEFEDAIRVEVHWGLTYADACAGDICHVPLPGEPGDVWWLGFDCAHAFDATPFTAKLRADQGFGFRSAADAGEVYRDVAYVRAQCEQLADQVIAARP